MPNSSTTPVIDSSTTTAAAVPIAYGYVWVTGNRAEYYMLQNTGDSNLDYTRVGIWLLGEAEWDGCHELWINDNLTWKNEFADPTQFHFHRGSDATIGSGLYPSSVGPDQGVDQFFSSFPSAIQPLAYSRVAYYSIMRKQPIENQTNTHQDDPTQWTDIAPIGLWRALRCRLFDDSGNMTGYAFTTNPVWHYVDAILRRKIFPEYNIDLNLGIDDLTTAARARFAWSSIYDSAQYCDEFLANGRRRFTGNYAFSSSTSLAAILEQILLCCRGFQQEYAGQLSLNIDQPRASVFTFSRQHVQPGSFQPSDQTVSQAPNCYGAQFRDLLIPTAAVIASISCADHQNPVVTTQAPHPFNTGDRLAIGGTNTVYDGQWTAGTVPDGTSTTTLPLLSKGSNYPASVGSGGSIGLLYSRFKERAPQFDHQANQLARGAIGIGLPRQRNRIRTTLDFATSTFDQVSRITRYERDRSLNYDQTPYVTPRALSLTVPMFAADAAGSGNAAVQIQPGDCVTIDQYASYAWQGLYEVLKRVDHPYNVSASGDDQSLTLTPAGDGGEIDFTLGPYDEGYMYDSTDPNSAGWSNVPNSDPGSDGNYTAIDLASNGTLAFLAGALQSASAFDLPSSGFSPSNMLAWAGPQGYLEAGHPMHVISLCDVDVNRVLTLNYIDGNGNIWHGDVNYAAVTWLAPSSAAATSNVGGITFLVATLDGGEIICFGQGIVANGTTIQLPSGFTLGQAFAMAFPHDGVANGNDAHGVGAYVDSGGVVHLNYQDGEGNIWHGNASVLIFAWQNNSGAVTTQTLGSAKWMTYQTAAGFVLGVGFGMFANGSTLQLPTAAGAADSLQAITSPHDWTDTGHPAHGVGGCYLDGTLKVNMFFEDGEGNVWYGDADVFALFYEPVGGTAAASADGISVAISPHSMSMALSGTLSFAAYVGGTTNTAVTWSVDGIAGGNATVGTVDSSGNYTAPSTAGIHTITATSQANIAAYASITVTVGSGSGNGGVGSVSVVVTPSSVSILPAGTYQLAATVSGTTNTAVTWSVDGIAGGNTSVGTISSAGLYTAPSLTGTHRITATSQADTSAAGSATVIIGTGGYGSPSPTPRPVEYA